MSNISLFGWMAWTQPTALFFIGIASILIIMTVFEIKSPCVERKGFLPISTTRGDRLFIGLLLAAFIHLLTLGATDWSIWLAFGVSAVLMLILLKWG